MYTNEQGWTYAVFAKCTIYVYVCSELMTVTRERLLFQQVFFT